ncbi:MAG TPA: hypothetical protein VFR07_17750 [Mycobacteriales bacterium]|jgi:hypothetical protein|nr:hypothetical protein [Mycobacteriales bacterium]
MSEYPAAYPPPAYVAQLRVYEPLAAFAAAERERWQEYAASGAAPATERGPGLERQAGLRALLGRSLPDLPEQAYVTEVDGVTLVCPWRTRLRAWHAVADIREELPEVLVDALLPRAVADAAQTDLATWQATHPEMHVHVRSSTWQVPLRWFVLVDAEERQVSPGGPGTATTAGHIGQARRTGRALVYRTPMSRARRRTARALAVLRRTLDDAAATAGVEDLARWLEEFHPRSLVELDYGGLVHLLDDEALHEDESAKDMAAALAALSEGNGDDAAAAYARVTARMKTLQSVESAG